jgi:4-amino-4-deoxy-L-arabinose transferase-like glycosyltransferase
VLRTGAAGRDVGTDRALTLLVAFGAFAFYVAVQRGEMVSWDGRVMAGVARNLWQHGSVAMYRDSFGIHPLWRLQWPYTMRGIGLPLVLAPLWALQLHVHGDVTDAVWLTLANPALLAATAAIVFRVGTALGWRRTHAVAAALAFAVLTMAPQYSTELFAEPGVTFATALAVLGCLRWEQARARGSWFVGTGVGIAILFRTDSIVLLGVVLVAVPLFVRPARLVATARSWIPALALPIGASLTVVGWYNDVRYGSPFTNAYVAGIGFTNPIPSGLRRLLLSPGKGFFWYDPILVAALPGLWWLWRRHRPLAATLIGLCLLRVVVYAHWPYPDGSVAWGPRFLLPLCPLLAIGFGETLERVATWRVEPRRVAWAAVGVLLAASAVVVLASLWVGYDQVWGEVSTAPAGTAPSRVAAVVAQQRHDFNDSIAGSNITRSLRELDRASPFPLRHFDGGPSPAGVAALAGFAACTAGAFVLARRRDRSRSGDAAADGDLAIELDDEDASRYETSQTGAASMSFLRSPGP